MAAADHRKHNETVSTRGESFTETVPWGLFALANIRDFYKVMGVGVSNWFESTDVPVGQRVRLIAVIAVGTHAFE
jgi:hypothetical protein